MVSAAQVARRSSLELTSLNSAHHPSRSLDSDDNGQFRLVGDDDDESEDEGDLDADADAVSLRSVRTVNVPKKSRQSSRSPPSRRSIDDASDTHTDQSGPPVLPPHSPALMDLNAHGTNGPPELSATNIAKLGQVRA